MNNSSDLLRLLFLADHKNRDVPPLAAIKLKLERLYNTGIIPAVDVQIISFDLWKPAIELLKPHLIILNHLHGRRNQTIADTIQRRGGLCIILPTEGRPNSQEQLIWATQQWPAKLCDLYLSWSNEFAKHLPEEVPVEVVGCPRLDFYDSPFVETLDSAEKICGLYDLDPTRPIITVASSFPQAKFAKQGQEFLKNDWKDLGVSNIPGKEIPANVALNEAAFLNTFQSWIVAAKAAYPDYQFVIKPHPAEDIVAWQRFCDQHHITLMLSGYIWDLLLISILHVGRADCLTVCEAWEMKRPTLFANIGAQGSGASQEAVDVSNAADSIDDFLFYMEDAASLELVYPDEQSLRDYNCKWIKQDNSTDKIAAALGKLLIDRNPVVSGYSFADRLELEKLVHAHSATNFYSQADGIGQFGKTVRRSDINYWLRKLSEVI